MADQNMNKNFLFPPEEGHNSPSLVSNNQTSSNFVLPYDRTDEYYLRASVFTTEYVESDTNDYTSPEDLDEAGIINVINGMLRDLERHPDYKFIIELVHSKGSYAEVLEILKSYLGEDYFDENPLKPAMLVENQDPSNPPVGDNGAGDLGIDKEAEVLKDDKDFQDGSMSRIQHNKISRGQDKPPINSMISTDLYDTVEGIVDESFSQFDEQ